METTVILKGFLYRYTTTEGILYILVKIQYICIQILYMWEQHYFFEKDKVFQTFLSNLWHFERIFLAYILRCSQEYSNWITYDKNPAYATLGTFPFFFSKLRRKMFSITCIAVYTEFMYIYVQKDAQHVTDLAWWSML